MRIEWGSEDGGGGGGGVETEAVRPSTARGGGLLRAALHGVEQWTRLESAQQALQLAAAVGSSNFTFTAPVAHYPGRGDLSLNLDLVYNSRVWQPVGPAVDRRMVFDIDDDWPAPGWSLHLGQLVEVGSGVAMVVEPDGTRRPFTITWSKKTANKLTVTATTTDGSHIQYETHWTFKGQRKRPYLESGWLVRTNGIRVDFDMATGSKAHATKLTDRNGNTITVEYGVPGSGEYLKKITDTCGRVVKFLYHETNAGNTELTKVVGPAPNEEWRAQQTDTDLVVVNFSRKNLTTSFALPVHEQPLWARIISGLYYPATQTGYWLPPDSYSSYGMLKRVQACRGMSTKVVQYVDVINGPGQVTSRRDYNYPDAFEEVVNDAPTYTTMSETWTNGRGDFNAPLVTTFAVSHKPTGDRTEITWPDNAKTVQEADKKGLPTELSILDRDGNLAQRTTLHWVPGLDGAPHVTDVRVVDSAGHVAQTTFAYGQHSTEPTLVDQREYSRAPVEAQMVLRRTQTDYVTDAKYLARNLRNLPQAVRVFEPFAPFGANPNPAVASWAEFGYDETGRGPAAGVPGFNAELYDPASGSYIAATNWRGNLTTLTRYADANDHAGPVIETRTYNICGNLLTADLDISRVVYEYGPGSGFLRPDRTWLTGTAPDAPKMLSSHVARWTFGGQPAHVRDANDEVTVYTYDWAGRLASSFTAAGGGVTVAHDDDALTTATSVIAGGPVVGGSVTTVDGRGRTVSVRTQRADGDTTVYYQHDFRNRLRAVGTPVRDGDAPSWDSVDLDVLGRPVTRIDADGNVTSWYYNEEARPDNRLLDNLDSLCPTVRVVGADGGEVWSSVDGLNRLRQVVTPAPDGAGRVIPTGALRTSYSYDALGNVTSIDLAADGLPTQQRRFRHDGLGRLTRQYLPECGDGISEHTAGGVHETWSAAFGYDQRSNLVRRQDARAVVTQLDYNDPLNRLQRVHYDTALQGDLVNPVVPCPDVLYTYETADDLRRVREEHCEGVSRQVYSYHPYRGLTSVTVTMDAAPDRPFTLDYDHDLLLRPTSTTLPAQYGDGAGNHRPDLHLRYGRGGLPDQLTGDDGAALADAIAYNEGGQISGMRVGPDGVRETYAHDLNDPTRLTGQNVKHGNVALLDIGYDYLPPSSATDPARKLRAARDRLDPDGTRQASYDRLGRLDDYTGGPQPDGRWGGSYRYDLHGNRATTTPRGDLTPATPAPADGETALTYDNANRLTSPGFAYEGAGNLVAARVDGVDFRYQYDAAGRLCWVQNVATGETTGYVFGACSRRRATVRPAPTPWPPATTPAAVLATPGTSVTFHIWDSDKVVAIYQADGADIAATLTWSELYFHLGARLLSTWTNIGNNARQVRYHHPGLTGTRYVTGPGALGQGAEQSPHETLPFGGALVHDAALSRPFTSYERDTATGLDYAVNRFYHPKLGRFLQPDPASASTFRPLNTQSLNVYLYCGNDPLNRVDPTGLVDVVTLCQYGDDMFLGCKDYIVSDPGGTNWGPDSQGEEPGYHRGASGGDKADCTGPATSGTETRSTTASRFDHIGITSSFVAVVLAELGYNVAARFVGGLGAALAVGVLIGSEIDERGWLDVGGKRLGDAAYDKLYPLDNSPAFDPMSGPWSKSARERSSGYLEPVALPPYSSYIEPAGLPSHTAPVPLPSAKKNKDCR